MDKGLSFIAAVKEEVVTTQKDEVSGTDNMFLKQCLFVCVVQSLQ